MTPKEMKRDLLTALRDWMRSTALTQVQIAKVLGISQGHVSEIMNLDGHRYTVESLFELWATAGGLWTVTLHHPALGGMTE